MSRYVIQERQIVDLEERKDARKSFHKPAHLPVVANCKTINGEFEGNIQNISSSGIFIKTDKPLSIGQELSLTFEFPNSQKMFAATGKIVRISNSGAALQVEVIFNKL
jgi:Tfp pilus assembly protein PilZ